MRNNFRLQGGNGAWLAGLASFAGLALLSGGCNLSRSSGSQDTPSDPASPPPEPARLIGPAPQFGAGQSLATPPPPISGGTLTVAGDGVTAFAADPDRDRVYVIDIPSRTVLRTYQLQPHDEPGRVAVDAKGRAYVALRSGAALFTIDRAADTTERRAACVAPRGVAYDASSDTVVLVCADGTLLRFPTGTGAATMRVTLPRDLRDVIVHKDGSMSVSTFRIPSILRVGAGGGLEDKIDLTEQADPSTTPHLLWRMVPVDLGDGEERVLAAAQKARQQPVPVSAGGYGGSGFDACPPGIVSGQMQVIGTGPQIRSATTQLMPQVTLPVDITSDGKTAVILGAGNSHSPGAPQIFMQSLASMPPSFETTSSPNCGISKVAVTPGQPIAIAFDGAGELLVQSREPAALYIMTPDRTHVWKTITLATDTREDTGHAVFHANTGTGVACASCHAEGGDDAHVWQFDGLGARRTPVLRGTTANTEPYHWDGSQKDMTDIVTHVFEGRMSGPKLEADQVSALKQWINALPAPPPIRGMDAAATRGQALFTTQGCSGCHSGPMLTSNQTVDVGTGAAFQVPSLKGVGWRAPFLHDGCATTLAERFGPCGGGQHGDTANLSPGNKTDLIAFLETL